MADRDGTAVDVARLAVQAQVLLDREVLRREGLVDLDQIEVLERGLVALESAADGRRRADAHDRRIAAGDAPAGELADGLEAALVCKRPGGEDERAGAVADAAGRAGVDDAVLLEDLGEPPEALDGGLRAVVLVAAELDGGALLAGQLHGRDLLGEPPAFLRRREALLALDHVLIHLALTDIILGCKVLGGHRHGQSGVAVGERLPEAVLELGRLAERHAEPQPARDVRRLRHVLAAADQRALAVARQHLQRRVDDGLEARAAEPVDGERGHVLRQARLQPDVAGEIDGVGAGLHHVAEDDVVDLLRLDPGLLDGGLSGVDREVGGGDVFQRASVGAKRRALRCQEDELGGDGLHGALREGGGA